MQYSAQFADAIKEFGEVQTKSPFFNPRAKHEICNAAVPLFELVAYFEFVYFYNFFSKIFDNGPCVK